jgi:hypothetical protein
MPRLGKRRILIPTLTLAIIAISGAAIAFWTSTGTGQGTATVGTSSGLTLSPVTITGTLYPGGTAATSSITINNPGSAAGRVTSIVLNSGAGGQPTTGNQQLSGIGGLPASGCPATDFTFNANLPVGGVNVPAGGSAVVNTGTLAMANSALNQDACKGLTLTIYLRAS